MFETLNCANTKRYPCTRRYVSLHSLIRHQLHVQKCTFLCTPLFKDMNLVNCKCIFHMATCRSLFSGLNLRYVNTDNSADYRHNFGILDIIKKTKIRMAHVGDVLLEMQSARDKVPSRPSLTFATCIPAHESFLRIDSDLRSPASKIKIKFISFLSSER
jgi:hypothetical protein